MAGKACEARRAGADCGAEGRGSPHRQGSRAAAGAQRRPLTEKSGMRPFGDFHAEKGRAGDGRRPLLVALTEMDLQSWREAAPL